MKNFKNLLLAGATVLAALAAPMNVFAKNVDPATVDSQETTLNYKVGSHYTWEILMIQGSFSLILKHAD